MHGMPKIVYLTLKGGVLQDPPPLGLKRINYTLGPIGLKLLKLLNSLIRLEGCVILGLTANKAFDCILAK